MARGEKLSGRCPLNVDRRAESLDIRAEQPGNLELLRSMVDSELFEFCGEDGRSFAAPDDEDERWAPLAEDADFERRMFKRFDPKFTGWVAGAGY